MCLWDGLAEHMMSEYWILDLYALAEETKDGWLFPKEKKSKQIVDGVEIPMHLIGYTAYPLWRCLMKGYTQRVQLTSEQIHFTHTLSSARMVLENVFGPLNENALGRLTVALCAEGAFPTRVDRAGQCGAAQ